MLKEVGDRTELGEREERWDKGWEKGGGRERRKGPVGDGKRGVGERVGGKRE